MTLICTYSNNKDLLEKEKERLEEENEDKVGEEDIEQLRIRCSILEEEQSHLHAESNKYCKHKAIIGAVIDELKK